MKQLTCEMCGATDLVKQDGVFVCQSCGCKYSLEEAKKMMIEVSGKVDVTGSTVKVDTSGELENLYQIARRARDAGDGASAARYYEQILLKEPTSWEATFYASYFNVATSIIRDVPEKTKTLANTLVTVFTCLENSSLQSEEKGRLLQEMKNQIEALIKMLHDQASQYIFKGQKILAQEIGKPSDVLKDSFVLSILDAFSDNYEVLWKYALPFAEEMNKRLPWIGDPFSKCPSAISQAQLKVEKIKDQRLVEYWQNHTDEKASLDAEKEDLISKISALDEKLQISGQRELDELTDKIDKLTSEKDGLGLFKGKEKKSIQEQIDQLNIQRVRLEQKVEAVRTEIKAQTAPLEARITEIERELSMER